MQQNSNKQQQQYFQSENNIIQKIEEQPTKLQILGQANPIYNRKNNQNQIYHDGPVGFRILPSLDSTWLTNYVPFRLFRSKNKQLHNKYNNDFNNHSLSQQQQQNLNQTNPNANIYKNIISSKQHSFGKLYKGTQIVYCKYDNSKHNKFKDITYFAGLFMPRDIITDKFKNIEKQKILCTFQAILQHKYFRNNPYNSRIQDSKNIGLSIDTTHHFNNTNATMNNNSTTNMSNNISQTHKKSHNSNKLLFSSNFESGNLFSSFRVDKYEYDLVMNNDINSLGSTQWFYFSVQGIKPNIDYTFNIVNFTKNDSLFNYGMKPVFYSLWQNNGIQPHQYIGDINKTVGWYRYGKNISYYKGDIQRQQSNRYYYALTFIINWRQPNDKIYLAHSYPYTHSRLVNLMKNIITINNTNNAKNQKNQKNDNKNEVTHTLNLHLKNKKQHINTKSKNKKQVQKNGINIQTIKYGKSISNKQLIAYCFSMKNQNIKKGQKQQAIIIMARQHPGQTQGSYVCQGILNKLVQNPISKQVSFLLQNYLIYVLPMINPDGVIFGNYRTNLGGKDLNRKWDTSQSSTSTYALTPQVSAVKQFLANLTTNYNINIKFVLDLHGHSKKFNSFFYGNPCPQSPQTVKMFPYMCSRFSQAVQFMDCTFTTQKYKKKAARIYLSSLYKQIHVYTFQSSFYGYTNRQGTVIQFTPNQYMKLGKVILNSLYFLQIKDKQAIMKGKLQQLKTLQAANKIEGKIQNKIEGKTQTVFYKNSIQIYQKFQSELKQNKLLLNAGDQDSSGSQSKPQQNQLNNQQIAYESEQQKQKQQIDERAIVNARIPRKQSVQKMDSIPSRSIRVNSLKQTQKSTIQSKQLLNKQFKTKKLATITQVNAVPDRYHISLLPIQRAAYKNKNVIDKQCQTDKTDKLILRNYKIYEIQQKTHLVSVYIIKQSSSTIQMTQDKPSNHYQTPKINKNYMSSMSSSKTSQPKKHSQIIAEIEKYRNFRESVQKQLINRRRLSQVINLKAITVTKQPKNNKKQVSVQTIITFKQKATKQPKSPTNLDYIKDQSKFYQQSIKYSQLIGTKCLLQLNSLASQAEQKDLSIQQLNKEIINTYIRRSAAIDVALASKTQKLPQKYARKSAKETGSNDYKC